MSLTVWCPRQCSEKNFSVQFPLWVVRGRRLMSSPFNREVLLLLSDYALCPWHKGIVDFTHPPTERETHPGWRLVDSLENCTIHPGQVVESNRPSVQKPLREFVAYAEGSLGVAKSFLDQVEQFVVEYLALPLLRVRADQGDPAIACVMPYMAFYSLLPSAPFLF